MAKPWRVRFCLLGALICLLAGCEKVASTGEKNPVPKDAVRLRKYLLGSVTPKVEQSLAAK